MHAIREVRGIPIGRVSTPRPRGARRASTETGSAREHELDLDDPRARGLPQRDDASGAHLSTRSNSIAVADPSEVMAIAARARTRVDARIFAGVSRGRTGARRRSSGSLLIAAKNSSIGRQSVAYLARRVRDAGAFSWQNRSNVPPPATRPARGAVHPRWHVVRRVGREPGFAPG